MLLNPIIGEFIYMPYTRELIKPDANQHISVENATGILAPTPPKIDLKTIDDIRLEMAKVYRDMKSQRIPTSDGTRLVYVLSQIGKLIELNELEVRMEALELVYESKK